MNRVGEKPVTAAVVVEFLQTHGVVDAGSEPTLTPMSGGVSSDIWLVDDGTRRVVVKTPLPALRVADDWQAPTERSRSEADWLAVVGDFLPGACPAVLAYDEVRHLLALEYLDPAQHRLWKQDLMEGRVDVEVAAAVGNRLGQIHRRSSASPGLAAKFATDHLFIALRLEPYFERLVDHHPQLAEPINKLVRRTLANQFALVHGDVSPKNILIGPDGPVFLDAETAWWGDPAFDVAFCLNHLLLKSLLPGHDLERHLKAVVAFATEYSAYVMWESPKLLESRVAGLLPALLLARVDGRSPVEYLDEQQRSQVRGFAVPLVLNPPADLSELIGLWRSALS